MSGRNARRRKITPQRRTPGSYAAWPHGCVKSSSYRSPSAHAKALLLDLLEQFAGFNNGDLCRVCGVHEAGHGLQGVWS
jgi:hypothetical protein